MTDKLEFKKGDAVKYIDPSSKLIPILLEDGWDADLVIDSEGDADAPSPLTVLDTLEETTKDELKELAKFYGLNIHHAKKEEFFRTKIKEYLESL